MIYAGFGLIYASDLLGSFVVLEGVCDWKIFL